MDHDQSQNDEARCPCWAPITDIPFPLLSQPSGPRHPREFTMAKAVVPIVPGMAWAPVPYWRVPAWSPTTRPNVLPLLQITLFFAA